MHEETTLKHVALQYLDREKAEIFFTKILGIPLKKKFAISPELSEAIFGIKENVEIMVYDNQRATFEVFITPINKKLGYEHTCIEIKDKKEFIKRCKKHGIKPDIIKKDNKKLLFVRDFAGNLFEVKEKQLL